MLTDRIVGAFTFRRGVYAEVEKDTTFTSTAWLLVAVAALLSQLGANATRGFVVWLFGSIWGTVWTVIAFAAAAFVIAYVGRTVFNASVTFEEVVRTVGLAQVWNAVGFIGIVAAVSRPLACLLTPTQVLAAIAGLVAALVAAKEALDLDWGQTIVTVIIGWVVLAIIIAIASAFLAILGLGAAGVASFLRG